MTNHAATHPRSDAAGARSRRGTKILFLAGAGRSGSTLLARIFGQLPGFASIGEFLLIWTALCDESVLCGCGCPFRECPFWTRVFDLAFGGFDNVDVKRQVMLQRRFVKERAMRKVGLPDAAGGSSPELAEYLGVMERLLEACATVSGARVIVDSSKNPQFGYLMSRIKRFDFHALQLVRDSRAVAHSWQRRKLRGDVRGELYMPTKSALAAAFEWNYANGRAQQLSRLVGHHKLLRYGDLACAPTRTLEQLLSWLGEPGAKLDFLDDDGVDFRVPNHTTWGNPDRLRMGRVHIRLDEEWREKMRLDRKATLAALTWPGLLRYGFVSQGEGGNRPASGAAPEGPLVGARVAEKKVLEARAPS